MAESGELKKIEQTEITGALFSYGMHLKPQDVDPFFKAVRVGVRELLNDVEGCLNSALESTKEFHARIEKIVGKAENLPEGASIGDDDETINFIISLTKDAYNYSEAGKLTSISRQTIKKHADKKEYGLRVTKISKSEYITRENLLLYYRNYFNKDGWGF